MLVNLVTQGVLAAASSVLNLQNGAALWNYFLFLLPMEAAILLIEIYLYAGRGLLTGHSKGRAALYAVTANFASAVLGYYLAEPVWSFVVSIS